MKRLLSIISVLMFAWTSGYAFIFIYQTFGPNEYHALVAEAYVPVDRKLSLHGSYTETGQKGATERKSYGGGFKAQINKRTDVGAGFIQSPEANGSRYRTWDVCAGYLFGERDLKLRASMFFQNTTYEEQRANDDWHTLNQYAYSPSVRLTLYRRLGIRLNTTLFFYSDNVNNYANSVESWSLRENRDIAGILGVLHNFPLRTETVETSFRIDKPLEIYGEWSKIYYERKIASQEVTSYGMRYFLTDHFVFSLNFITFDETTYQTVGFGLYW